MDLKPPCPRTKYRRLMLKFNLKFPRLIQNGRPNQAKHRRNHRPKLRNWSYIHKASLFLQVNGKCDTYPWMFLRVWLNLESKFEDEEEAVSLIRSSSPPLKFLIISFYLFINICPKKNEILNFWLVFGCLWSFHEIFCT